MSDNYRDKLLFVLHFAVDVACKHRKAICHIVLFLDISKNQNIRNFNRCDVRIENSATRVIVRHHEACRGMPNRYPEWNGIFNSQLTAIMDSFSCLFFLRQVQLNIYRRFYQYYLEISTSSVKKCSVRLLLAALTSKLLAENDVNTEALTPKRHRASCTRVAIHPTFPCASQSRENSYRVCKNCSASVRFREVLLKALQDIEWAPIVCMQT